MNFNKQLDKELFNNITDCDKFCRDGLVMKYGEPEDSVDAKWEKVERRVAFILKDNPDGWATDLRTWLIGEGENYNHNRALRGGNVGKTGFLPNIARMFYGLYANPCIGFNELNMAEVKKVWNEAPFALIESKKIAGSSTVSHKEINVALESDNGDLLQKELEILRPNIIVCCDPSRTIFDFVTKYYMSLNGSEIIKHEYDYVLDENAVPIMKCCAWYFKNINVLVILSFHPTRLGKSNWKIYERAVSPLRTFPQKEDLHFNPLNIIL